MTSRHRGNVESPAADQSCDRISQGGISGNRNSARFDRVPDDQDVIANVAAHRPRERPTRARTEREQYDHSEHDGPNQHCEFGARESAMLSCRPSKRHQHGEHHRKQQYRNDDAGNDVAEAATDEHDDREQKPRDQQRAGEATPAITLFIDELGKTEHHGDDRRARASGARGTRQMPRRQATPGRLDAAIVRSSVTPHGQLGVDNRWRSPPEDRCQTNRDRPV